MFWLQLRKFRRGVWRHKVPLLKFCLFLLFVTVFVVTLLQLLRSPSEIRILVLDTEADAGLGATWTVAVEGYAYYRDLDHFASDHERTSEFDLKNIFKPRNAVGEGLWLQSRAQGVNVIRVTEFQFPDMEDKEVLVALHSYVHGRGAYLQVNLRNSATEATSKFVITSELFENGFCNKIIPLEFSGGADQIEIISYVDTNDGHTRSFVLIDKVLVVVAAAGTSRSFMHSLMPSHWCP